MWRIRWFCCLWRSIRFTSAMNIWTYLDWNQSVKRSNFSFKIAVGSNRPLFFTKRIGQPFNDLKTSREETFFAFWTWLIAFHAKKRWFLKKIWAQTGNKISGSKIQTLCGFLVFWPRKWAQKGRFLAKNRKFYFRVKKALFLYALPARSTDRQAAQSTLESKYRRVSQHLKDTPV